jgi:hypothetical protein
MLKQDKSSFCRLLEAVFVLHGRKLTQAVSNLYWQGLQAYGLADIRQALHQHSLDPDVGQFCPKPADVVRQLNGSRDSQALSAFSKVINALKTIGTYPSVVFDDPIIHCVISDMGGWIKWGKVTDDDLKFRLTKEFETRYCAYVGKPLADYPKMLTGISQAGNRLSGYQQGEVRYIGNREQAKLTYQQGQSSDSIAHTTINTLALT